MGQFISCILEWLFRDSHADGEFAYLFFLGIMGYISKTYWDSSRIAIQAMKQEYELIYGPTENGQKLYKYDFDEILDSIKNRLNFLNESDMLNDEQKIHMTMSSRVAITKENNLDNTESLQDGNKDIDGGMYNSYGSSKEKDEVDQIDSYMNARSRRIGIKGIKTLEDTKQQHIFESLLHQDLSEPIFETVYKSEQGDVYQFRQLEFNEPQFKAIASINCPVNQLYSIVANYTYKDWWPRCQSSDSVLMGDKIYITQCYKGNGIDKKDKDKDHDHFENPFKNDRELIFRIIEGREDDLRFVVFKSDNNFQYPSDRKNDKNFQNKNQKTFFKCKQNYKLEGSIYEYESGFILEPDGDQKSKITVYLLLEFTGSYVTQEWQQKTIPFLLKEFIQAIKNKLLDKKDKVDQKPDKKEKKQKADKKDKSEKAEEKKKSEK